MEVHIDGEPLAPDGPTYCQILDAARAHAARRGRLVVGVEIDGRSLSIPELDSLAAGAPCGNRVNLFTEAPGSLIRLALTEAATLLRDTDGPRDSAVKHIRDGRLGDALRDIGTLSAAWQRARLGVEHSAELLGQSPSDLLAPDSPPTSHPSRPARPVARQPDPIQLLAACLTELSRCVRDADWSGLADVVEYDLAERSAEWIERLMCAAARVAAAEQPARQVA